MRKHLLIFLVTLQATTLFCRQLTDPVSLLTNFSQEFIQEKVYAHIDRTDHLAGDILWFKIYTVDATQHKLLDLSKVVYVEILDRNNTPIAQTKVELAQGLGQGSLYLPSTVQTGSYIFRAYTNWMKNLDSSFFYQQHITIINTLKSMDAEATIQSIDATLLIHFFPEGGLLAENVLNRVAFKIADNRGNGVSIKGILLNNSNDTIAKIETLKFGIGRFEFEPKQGEEYRAILFLPDNTQLIAKLPPAGPGYSLMLSPDEGKIKIVLRGQENNFKATLIAHTRQSIKSVQTSLSQQGVITFFLDPLLLDDGISHITIFDSQNSPLCERLFFKKPGNKTVLVKTNQEAYNIRRKVTLALSATDIRGGDYSISVYRADSLDNGNHIGTHLLLTSDLTGTIESPEFYLSDNPISYLAADNLMLTHGWRRFSWDKLNEKLAPRHLPEVRGHLIQGKIVDSSGKPVSAKRAYLTIPDKKVWLYASRSDLEGVIRFQMNNQESKSQIIAQVDLSQDSSTHIEIKNPFSTQKSTLHAKDVKLSSAMEVTLLNRSVSLQVQDIFWENETYYSFFDHPVDSISFYGEPDESYLLDDYTRFPVMEEVMREYVKSVAVRKNKNNFNLQVVNKLENKPFKENPLVLLDGVPIFDINQVMAIDPLKIKRLDVVARKYYIGLEEFPGIVSLSTYHGDLAEFPFDARRLTLNYEGLQQLRQFYSPQYENQIARASRIPDQRNFLYWNPSIKVIAGKETTLDFFTSDVEGKFYIVLEGISWDGIPDSATQSFMVSR
jgi:hypothetical protein